MVSPLFLPGLVLACLVLVAGIRWGLSDFPLERDEGLYVHFAQLLLEGGLPYESFYDPKPPGLFYLYAGILTLFGQQLWQLHLAFLLINVATAMGIYGLTRPLYGQLGGAAGTLGFALLSLHPFMGGLSMLSEHLVILFVIWGMYFLMARGIPVPWRNALSGLCFGLAVFAKQPALFFALGALVFLVIHFPRDGRETGPRQVIGLASFAVALVLPMALVFLFLQAQSLGGEFFYWNLEYILRHSLAGSPSDGVIFLRSALASIVPLYGVWFFISLVGLLFVVLRPSKGLTKSFVLIFAVASVLSILPRWTFHGHYFLLLVPMLSVAAASCFFHCQKLWQSAGGGHAWCSLALVGIFAGQAYACRSYFFGPDYASLMRQMYGTNPFYESFVVADSIRARSSPADALVVLGGEPQLYYYTDLRAPTKHLYGPYLVDGSDAHQARQSEFIQDVEGAPPRFLVISNHPLSWVPQAGADRTILDWQADFCTAHYRVIGVADISVDAPTVYAWDEEASVLETTGVHQLIVWERRAAALVR